MQLHSGSNAADVGVTVEVVLATMVVVKAVPVIEVMVVVPILIELELTHLDSKRLNQVYLHHVRIAFCSFRLLAKTLSGEEK